MSPTQFEALFLQTFLHIKRQSQKPEGPRLTPEQKVAFMKGKEVKPYEPLTYAPIPSQWVDKAEHPICVKIKQAIRDNYSTEKFARLRAV